MFELSAWQWALAALGAFMVGVSKTGVPGLGILSVAIFAFVFPAEISPGVLLPLLVVADVVAVASYRRHAVWLHLWKLFPWVALGIVGAFLWMKWIDVAHAPQARTTMERVIGGILIIMVGLHCWRVQRGEMSAPQGIWFAAATGVAGGFATMTANAAGPIMILYMLAMGLPKLEFMGTGAWYFLALNVFKLPFSWNVGQMTEKSLWTNAALVGAVIAGAVIGRFALEKVNQRWFEVVALALTAVAAVYFLIK
jgi:uncharacterized membrane protein YfcA